MILCLVPEEEGEEPGEGSAEDGSFDGSGDLVPCGVAVQEGFEEDVEERIRYEPCEEETPGWFVLHVAPLRFRPSPDGTGLGGGKSTRHDRSRALW